jgi:hypothetical protein
LECLGSWTEKCGIDAEGYRESLLLLLRRVFTVVKRLPFPSEFCEGVQNLGGTRRAAGDADIHRDVALNRY